ncbi:MAG: DUF697 domain-containing protein [Planctomycetota bacterium]|nr:DUF697 domain-containing protein [Planctomycetota bacterium]
MAAPLQDFGRVMRALFRFARYISFGIIGLMIVFLAFRVAEVYRFFADIEPWLGTAFLVVFGLLLVLLVGRPVYRFLKVPAALKPPPLPPMEERRGRDLVRHLAFVEGYLAALVKNPEWEGAPAEVEAAIERCRALREEAAHAGREAVAALSDRVGELERDTVQRLLEPLDRKVRTVIRQEAVGVGIATAVSWNGTIDAFIVLWRNCNLVSRVARIYYGRPGVRGTLAILRDVSAATIAGAYLQDLTEAAGGALGGLFGKTVGALGGPLLDGAVNGVVTLRIGYMAKARCRSFSAWNEAGRVEAARDAFKEAGAFSKDVVTEIFKTVGTGLWKIPGKAIGKLGDALGGFFKKPEEGVEPAGA